MIFGFVLCYFLRISAKTDLFNLRLVFYPMAEDSSRFCFFFSYVDFFHLDFLLLFFIVFFSSPIPVLRFSGMFLEVSKEINVS